MNNKLYIAFLFFISGILYFSCEQPERTVLTSAERELVDSLYSKGVAAARKEADSICDATYQAMFDRVADSIKQVYIDEIREIVEGEG